MSNKKDSEMNDDEFDMIKSDNSANFQCAASNIRPMLWALLIAFLVIVGFLLLGKNTPDTVQVVDSIEEPISLFQNTNTAQPVAWIYQGRQMVCPSCGWRGTRLAINAKGKHICPQCRFCPFLPVKSKGIGVAAVSSASPVAITSASKKPVQIKELGIEVVNTQRGILVTTVYGNSNAEKGGLKHGDIISTFNHKSAASVIEFQNIVSGAPPEKRVTAKIMRFEKQKKLILMVGEGEMEGVIIPSKVGMTKQNGMGAVAGLNTDGNTNLTIQQKNYISCPGCGFRMLDMGGAVNSQLCCPRCNSIMIR